MTNNTISIQDLGAVDVLNQQGQPLKLATLWSKRTAVLVFVRHFG